MLARLDIVKQRFDEVSDLIIQPLRWRELEARAYHTKSL